MGEGGARGPSFKPCQQPKALSIVSLWSLEFKEIRDQPLNGTIHGTINGKGQERAPDAWGRVASKYRCICRQFCPRAGQGHLVLECPAWGVTGDMMTYIGPRGQGLTELRAPRHLSKSTDPPKRVQFFFKQPWLESTVAVTFFGISSWQMAFLGSHVSPEILPSSWLSALSCKDLATLEMASASGLRDLKAHRTAPVGRHRKVTSDANYSYSTKQTRTDD